MKILFAHNYYQLSGGEDEVVHSEIALIKEMGHKLHFFSIHNNEINNIRAKIKSATNLIYSFKSKQKIIKTLKQFKPDVVHVHNFFPLITPSVYDACAEIHIPCVQSLHNYRTICPGALLLRKGEICEKCVKKSLCYAIIHRCYKDSIIGSIDVAGMVKFYNRKKHLDKVNRFICLTEFSKKKFIQSGFPANKISVKPNFVKNQLNTKGKSSNHHKKALFVGRLSQEKGIDTLIKAWKTIDYPLEIVGTGPLLNKIQNNVPQNIRFSGYLPKEKVMQKMAESSFLIMPSICYEGFPMVIVESFACGLPVIASKLGSMEEIIQDGITGMHFKPGDPYDLSKKINQIISSPEKLHQMGINARDEYEQKYTPEKNYNMLIKIYNEVIEEYKRNGF